jgi:hypothetical protein
MKFAYQIIEDVFCRQAPFTQKLNKEQEELEMKFTW